ncbi:hypothetical protein TRIATDRAFT_255041, partial [Trichoderma atroviride IMI 206040]
NFFFVMPLSFCIVFHVTATTRLIALIIQVLSPHVVCAGSRAKKNALTFRRKM